VLAYINCRYYQPIFYPGYVTVYSRVDEVKNTSIIVQHRIHNGKDECVAEAQDILVCYDFNKNVKVPVPDDIR